MSALSRIREFRHAFTGHRRITATIRIDLARAELLHTGDSAITHCRWDGSKERQPSVELYPEFRAWFDDVLAYVVAQTGKQLLFVFEPPGDPLRAELWIYAPGKPPQLIKALRKPSNKPLTEEFFGLKEDWEDTCR